MWKVSESFPELAQVISEVAQPGRIDIVRAKKHLLGELGDGQPHSSEALIASVASLLGAGPLGHPQIDLPGRESVKAVVTAEHPVAAEIRADITAREALAELAADGMLIAAGQAALPGTPALTLTYHLPSSSARVRIGVHRPAVLSDVVRLPHRLRRQGLWGIEPDIFIADLGLLLIPGQNAAFGRQSSPTAAACSSPQPASSAPPSRARGTRRASACAWQHPQWTSSSTATARRSSRAQSPTPCETACPATAGGRRTRSASLPASCATSATTGSTPGICPTGTSIYFEEDKCGLLFLEAHRHLKRLAAITADATGPT